MRLSLVSLTLLAIAGRLAAEDTITVTAPADESLHAQASGAGALVPAEPGELPMAVEVLPQRLLDSRYTATFYETLEYTTGVYTGGNSSFTASSGRPAIRGFTGNDVMLDGLPLPARMPIFLDAMGFGAVEIWKGPLNSTQGGQSGLQGSGGAMNLLGRSADPAGSFHRVALGGTFGNGSSGRLTMDANVVLIDGLALRAPLALVEERPFYLPDDLDPNQGVMVAPSLRWNLDERTALTLSTTWQQAEKAAYQGIPYLKGHFLVPITTYYGDGQTRDEYTGATIQLRLDHTVDEHLACSAGYGYARAEEERRHWSVMASNGANVQAYYNLMEATGTGRFSFVSGRNLDQNLAAFGQLRYGLDLGAARNQLALHVDWLKRKTQMQSGTSANTGFQDLADPVLPTPDVAWGARTDSALERHGVAIQDFITWGDWRLLLGARLDRHESALGNEDVALSPRAALTWMPRPDWSLYGNYTLAEGPNLGNRISAANGGGEMTDEWRSEQIELGTRKRFFDNLWATACVFRITQEHTPEADPLASGYYLPEGAGKNRSQGAELGLSGEVTPAWSWWGSYTNLRYEDIDDGIGFTRYPRNSVSLWTAYRLQTGALQGLCPSLGARYTSSYLTTFRGAYIGEDYVIAEKTVVDAALEYPLRALGGATLALGVKNVFDEVYVESNRHGSENFPGLPRTCWARISVDF